MLDRRDFLTESLAAAFGLTLAGGTVQAFDNAAALRIATFRFDVTPPKGHGCCGGWIKPVETVDDELEALGLVILGAGQPVVLCAVDWTGLLNEAHVEWRKALAAGAGTTPDRVAVHCVHQHNAPMACAQSERTIAPLEGVKYGEHILDLDFFQQCLARGREAVRTAVTEARPLTHVATGQGKVEKVASNRRVFRDDQGRIKAMRGSACSNDELIALPEGLIDPWLKTVAFYDGNTKIAALHYYATHPMSYYADGRVTSDFAGLARKRRQADEPGCRHIYFTGCAGNVAAGKYNNGSKEARAALTQRVYDGIVASEQNLRPEPVTKLEWRTVEAIPVPRRTFDAAALLAEISKPGISAVARNRPAYMLSWLKRVEQKIPIVLSSLHLNGIKWLHLPAESFIEYQLRAQSFAPDSFVVTAAYGDGGPWYIPVKEEYPAGGYEVSVAFCEPSVDDVLTEGMRRLLS